MDYKGAYPCGYAGSMGKLTDREKMERKDILVQIYALDLGENLHACRTTQNRTQEDVAAGMGTKHARVSNIENGLVDARLSDIVKIARALGVEPGDLLDFSLRKLKDYPEHYPDGHAKPS